MLEELTHRLNSEVFAFTNGEGDIGSLDRAINIAQEISEKLIILRYKAYETKLFPTPDAEVPLQEFDMDLTPSPEKPEPLPIAEAIQQDAPPTTAFPASEEEIPPHAESIIVTDVVNAAGMNELPFHEDVSAEIHSAPLNLRGLIGDAKGKHEKIDVFNGNYSLKEKITFINTLFGGSSESFGSAVKKIDATKGLDEMLPELDSFAQSYRWQDADRQILNRFLEKLAAKYA